MDRLCAEFPQIRPYVFFARLPPDIDVREFGFWLFNKSRPTSKRERAERSNGVLLVYDWASDSASLTVGYNWDAFLGDLELRQILQEAAEDFMAGRYGNGIAAVMGGLQYLLREKHEAAVVVEEKWKKEIQGRNSPASSKRATSQVRLREKKAASAVVGFQSPEESDLDLDLALEGGERNESVSSIPASTAERW
ncbi:MAG: TPM domain-containing protein [Verrucomicrobiota bacterium]